MAIVLNQVRGGLLRAGAAAGPLFVSTFTVLGATRAGYEARRYPVSSLALGQAGWLQRANSVITGLAYVGGAAALARAPRRVTGSAMTAAFTAAAGVGLVGSGVFVTDPVDGFPAGQAAPARPSRAGQLHNLFAVPIFLGIPAATLQSAWGCAKRRDRGWAWYSGVSGAVMATAVGLSVARPRAPQLAGYGGLIQRVSIVAGFGWLTALFARAWRQQGCQG